MRCRELCLQHNRRFGYDCLNTTKNIISQEREKEKRKKLTENTETRCEYFRKKYVKIIPSEIGKFVGLFFFLLSTVEFIQSSRNQKLLACVHTSKHVHQENHGQACRFFPPSHPFPSSTQRIPILWIYNMLTSILT